MVRLFLIMKMSKAPPIGIDLGTTFSAAAIYRPGKCDTIPNKDGDRLTPSYVFYHPDTDEVSIGTIAAEMSLEKCENFIFGSSEEGNREVAETLTKWIRPSAFQGKLLLEVILLLIVGNFFSNNPKSSKKEYVVALPKNIKRIMGRRFDDVYVQELINSGTYRYKIVRGKGNGIEIEVLHNGVTVRKTPEEVSSEILKYLKDSATENLGVEVTEAVISVPAYFSNGQRKATKMAAELAGLKVLKLITEPVAAAIHYSEDRLNKPSTLLVFDFGGGTLDVSIIKVDGKTFEVKSVEGDTFLGGRDIDRLLMEHFKPSIVDKFGSNIIDETLSRRVEELCIRLKTSLSKLQKRSLKLDCLAGTNNQFTLSLSREQFEELAKDLFYRAIKLTEKCVIESGLKKEDITEVVLAGGTTRILKIRESLGAFFGVNKIRTNLNPDEAVALGAATQAGLLSGNLKELEKYRITQVTPLSLGLGCDLNLMVVAISKNSRLPTKSAPIEISTIKNNQHQLDFEVYEGERKNCKLNNLLGEFMINDLPPGKDGEIKTFITFTLDEDGILEVEAVESSTGKKKQLVVTIGEYRLCDYQIRRSLEDAEKNKLEDEQFETFVRYLWKIRRDCNHIIYDLGKIPIKEDQAFVLSKCKSFLAVVDSVDYTEIGKLRASYEMLKKSVRGIVEDVIEVNFDDVSGEVVYSNNVINSPH